MLNPSMQELMKRVGNRYLLVNLAAQRARDIADEAEEKGEEAPIHEFEEEEETIVEDWDFEPEEEEEEIKESNHLMIEAEDPAAGLAMALDSLKRFTASWEPSIRLPRSAVQTFPIAASHRWRSAWQARTGGRACS